ncbi:hypothetical protein OBBRIDRAFT_697915, partial [Obba rivulosa]
FDTLSLWFEAGVPNCYDLNSSGYPMAALGVFDDRVTFKSSAPDLPLPDPELLELHATCCKVAHLSGATGMYGEL